MLRQQKAEHEARLAEIIDELEGVGSAAASQNRDLTEDDQAIITNLNEESDRIEKSLEIINGAIKSVDKANAAKLPAVPQNAIEQQPLNEGGSLTLNITAEEAQERANRARLPALARYNKSKIFDSQYEAFAMGKWVLAMCGNQQSQNWCRENGIIDGNVSEIRNDMTIGVPTAGGNAVPTPMAATMIRLVEEFGVYRRYAREAVMTSNTLDVPKITGHSTVYYPAEGADITASDLTIGQVNLVAKKYASRTLLSTELQEDAVVSMVDQIMIDFAWNFAKAEDTNSFLGDGSGAFGGITGIASAVLASSTVTAAGAALALGDLEIALGKLPQYAGIRPRWYMHSYTYYSVIVPALVALGGTDMRQTEEGGEMMLYGYPVTFTQVLPGAAQTNDDMVAVLGDLSLGAYCGTRRNFTLRQLNELYAQTDQIGVIATMRADSVIHETGTATPTDPAGAIIKIVLPPAGP